MAFVYEEKYSYPVRVMLNLTDNCNLACRYCFVQ
jgi:MoaA/NifB/PqqE/SkfB family radical SAM enzyme